MAADAGAFRGKRIDGGRVLRARRHQQQEFLSLAIAAWGRGSITGGQRSRGEEHGGGIYRFGRAGAGEFAHGSAAGFGRRHATTPATRLMFFAEAQIRVHLYGQPTDMRKSYDGLQALARHAMGRDPLDGALYIFVNRRGSQIKCLYFDRSGFCIWAKRLETGRFIGDWRSVRTREMDWTGLKLLLEGLEGKRVRKRFSLPSIETKSL